MHCFLVPYRPMLKSLIAADWSAIKQRRLALLSAFNKFWSAEQKLVQIQVFSSPSPRPTKGSRSKCCNFDCQQTLSLARKRAEKNVKFERSCSSPDDFEEISHETSTYQRASPVRNHMLTYAISSIHHRRSQKLSASNAFLRFSTRSFWDRKNKLEHILWHSIN